MSGVAQFSASVAMIAPDERVRIADSVWQRSSRTLDPPSLYTRSVRSRLQVNTLGVHLVYSITGSAGIGRLLFSVSGDSTAQVGAVVIVDGITLSDFVFWGINNPIVHANLFQHSPAPVGGIWRIASGGLTDVLSQPFNLPFLNSFSYSVRVDTVGTGVTLTGVSEVLLT